MTWMLNRLAVGLMLGLYWLLMGPAHALHWLAGFVLEGVDWLKDWE